jgi:hypothetical protein
MQLKFTILGLLALGLLFAVPAVAQEVSLFKLTEHEGYFGLQYFLKSDDTESVGITTHMQNWTGRSDLYMNTRGYIYHPNLLEFELGGGIAFNHSEAKRTQTLQASNEAIETSSSGHELLWNMNLFMRLMKQKPYPVSLYYRRSNPLQQTGNEGDYNQLLENYGLQTQLMDVLPMNLNLAFDHNSAEGQTLDRVIDRIDDRLTFKANRFYSRGNRLEFIYELRQLESRNGDPRRELVEINRASNRAYLASNWSFGSNDQFQFSESASYSWADNPDVTTLNVAPALRWQHTPKLYSNYRYSFMQIERPEVASKSTTQSALAMVSYKPTQRLGINLSADLDKFGEAGGFSEDSHGGRGRFNYDRDLSSTSRISISGALGYQLRDRQSEIGRIDIFEEIHILVGTTPATLNRDYVVADSIVVRNETGSQTFIKGIDYQVRTLGTQTQIERLIRGSILDGETVSVDYSIETGGTFSYTIVNQNFNVDFSFARYYKLFARYSDTAQTVVEGVPTNPLNSQRLLEFGGRLDIPSRWYGLDLGGGFRLGRQMEDINPFDRLGLDAYVRAPLPYRLDLQVNLRYDRVNYRYSSEDQNLVAVNGNLSWSSRRNLRVVAEAYFEQDTGGSDLRQRTQATLRLDWGFRRLTVGAEARYNKEVQGDLKKDALSIWLRARRVLF